MKLSLRQRAAALKLWDSSLKLPKEWLYQKYIIEELSLRKIGKLCGHSRSTISQQLKEWEIPVRSPSESQAIFQKKQRGSTVLDDPKELKRLYIDEGLTRGEIGQIAGVGTNQVRRCLLKYGIPIRTMSEAKKLERWKERGSTILDDPEELRRLYLDEEMGAQEIGQTIGVGSYNVRKHLQRYGIPIRTASEARATSRTQERISGSNNPLWRGGISKKQRATGFTRNLKKRIRARDNHRCTLCGASREFFRDLAVHHRDFDKNNHSEDNLVTLCQSCHSTIHANNIKI